MIQMVAGMIISPFLTLEIPLRGGPPSLGYKWFNRFPGPLNSLLNCHGLGAYYHRRGVELTVLLQDGVIPMATIDTAPAAAPHLAITRFYIDELLSQHQSMTACTGHCSPPFGDFINA